MNESVANGHDWHYGAKFIKWGLGWFIFGTMLGLGVLIYYLVGATYNTTNTFLGNVVLWFGSPLTLSASFTQVAGLAMAVLGVAKLLVLKWKNDPSCCATTTSVPTNRGCCSLKACNFGLILLFLLGFIGYYWIDAIWNGFYYTPIIVGKNLWLFLQGGSILIFFFGFLGAFSCLCKCCCTKKTV